MVNQNAEEVEALNAYTYSVDSAIEELEKGGWVYNKDGSDYSGEGIRYKKLEDGSYMPLEVEWFSSREQPCIRPAGNYAGRKSLIQQKLV